MPTTVDAFSHTVCSLFGSTHWSLHVSLRLICFYVQNNNRNLLYFDCLNINLPLILTQFISVRFTLLVIALDFIFKILPDFVNCKCLKISWVKNRDNTVFWNCIMKLLLWMCEKSIIWLDNSRHVMKENKFVWIKVLLQYPHDFVLRHSYPWLL